MLFFVLEPKKIYLLGRLFFNSAVYLPIDKKIILGAKKTSFGIGDCIMTGYYLCPKNMDSYFHSFQIRYDNWPAYRIDLDTLGIWREFFEVNFGG